MSDNFKQYVCYDDVMSKLGAMIDYVKDHSEETYNPTNLLLQVSDMLICMPKYRGDERDSGKWVYDPNGMDWNLPAWRCGVCGCRNDNLPANMPNINPLGWAGGKYCPNCGARMEYKNEQKRSD